MFRNQGPCSKKGAPGWVTCLVCSQVLPRKHADTCPRDGQQSVLLLYFSWAHTPDLTFLARNQMGTLISITLLEISLQVSGRGFSWRQSLVLLVVERELVPRARREDRAEVGSHTALLWWGCSASRGVRKDWPCLGSECYRWAGGVTPGPEPPSCLT